MKPPPQPQPRPTEDTEGCAHHELVVDDAGVIVDYRIVDVNPAYESITGIPRHQVKGALATAAYRTRTAPFLERYALVALSGEPDCFETFSRPLKKRFRIAVSSPSLGRFTTVFSEVSG